MRRRWQKQMPSFRPVRTSAPPISECDRFLGLLLTSGLASSSDLRELCASFDTNRSDENALDDMCILLVATKRVTEWQCKKLRMGKWKGFYLDDYRLLGPSEPEDPSNNKFVAEEVSTRKQVILAVKPLKVSPWVEYSIGE